MVHYLLFQWIFPFNNELLQWAILVKITVFLQWMIFKSVNQCYIAWLILQLADHYVSRSILHLVGQYKS